MLGKSVIQVEVKSVLSTSNGSAVFLGNDEKCFVIHVDHRIGPVINSFHEGTPRPRPNTHDLFFDVLTAFGGQVERMIVNDFADTVFYARLIVSAENELDERKIIDVDARPSDAIALCLLFKAPIYVIKEIWDCVDDMSELLRQLRENSDEDGTVF